MLNEKGLIEFTIGIAGIGISFLFDQNLSESGVEDIYYEFITDIRPEIKLRVHQDSFPERSKGKKIFDSGSTWALFRDQGKYVLQDSTFDSDPPPNRLVILESDFKSGDIYNIDELNQNFLTDPLGYPLNQVLMILLLSRKRHWRMMKTRNRVTIVSIMVELKISNHKLLLTIRFQA